MKRLEYSIVVPAYNEQEVIESTHRRLTQVLRELGSYEIIYVNDGSKDQTLALLRKILQEDSHVVVLSFSRNFGHQAAATAGMRAARGEAVVLIDADLQDPPEVILEMAGKWKSGAQVVYGKRIKRKGETLFKKITSAVYYRIFRMLSESSAPLDTGDFRLMDRQVVDEINAMPEHNRYLRGMVAWAGFRQEPVEFVREERTLGETKYTLKKMLRLAGNGITAFSSKPLRLPMYLGAFLMIGSALALLVQVLCPIWGGVFSGLYAFLTAIVFLMGMLFLCMGVLGLYLSRVYDEVKGRPEYIVETVERGEENDG